MSTTRLTIQDGKITDYVDRYFESLSADGKKYQGNGWTVVIHNYYRGNQHRIICHAEQLYCNGQAVCHREFRLADGILDLAGGGIATRYVHFHRATTPSTPSHRTL